MTNAFEVREYRHASLRLNPRHQTFAASRHDDVDIAIEPCQHLADGGAVAGRHELDGGLRQGGGAQAFGHRRKNSAAGAQTIRAAAQDRRVPGFQAKHARIGGNVRPAFIDDANDAEWHPDALDSHPVGAGPGFCNGPNRILERPHHIDAFCNGFHARWIKREPVEKCSRDSGGARLGDVLSVGGQNWGNLCPDRGGHELKGAIFLLSRSQRQHPGGRAGTATDLAHGGGNVAGSLDTLERRGHISRKTRKNPCPWALSYHVEGSGGEVGPVRAWQGSALGITWITERGMQQIN